MFARLIFLFIVLTVYPPVYSQDTSIGQRIKELKKTQKLHVIYDSKLNLKAPANSVKWEQKGNNVFLIPKEKDTPKEKANLPTGKKKKQQIKHTISGYVKDENEEPLINATIFDENTQMATMTNEHGFFSLTLPEGKHHIEVSFLGLSKVHKNLNLTSDQKLQFHMHEDNTLDEVVVCADMNSPLLNTQMGKRTFTHDDLSKGFSFMSSPDVIKLLQQVSGTASGIELASGLYVHGGNGDENLFLLDDSPLYQINHSMGLFSSFNTEMIKNVDFYKSGFPARFNGRLSSITDVRTIDGNPRKIHGSVSLGLLDGKINLEGPIVKDKTTFAFGIRRSWLDFATRPVFAIVNHNKRNKFTMNYLFYDLNAKVTHHLSDNDKLYLSLYSGLDKYNTCDKEKYDEDFSETDNDFKWGNTNIALGWNKQISPKQYFNLIGTFTHNHTLQEYTDKEESEISKSVAEYKSMMKQNSQSSIYDLSIKADWEYHPNTHHKLKIGGNYTTHSFVTETQQTLAYQNYQEETGDTMVVRGKSTRNSHEVMIFAEDEWHITPKWSGNIGLNISSFFVDGKSYLQAGPRLALKYQVNDGLSLKMSYTKMSQYVHRITSTYLDMPTDYWVPTTKHIQPAYSTQIAFGTYAQFSPKWLVSIESFYKKSSHLLLYQSYMGLMPPATRWEQDVLSGKGKAYGIEIDAQYKSKKISWAGAYTLSWSKRLFEGIADYWFRDKFDNRHKISLSFFYKINNKIDLNANWLYHSGNRISLPASTIVLPNMPGSSPSYDTTYRFTSPNNAALPAYHRLDLGANFHHKNAKGRERIWNVSIYNAYCHLNTMYVDVRQDNKGKFRASSKGYIPIIPSVSYTWKF